MPQLSHRYHRRWGRPRERAAAGLEPTILLRMPHGTVDASASNHSEEWQNDHQRVGGQNQYMIHRRPPFHEPCPLSGPGFAGLRLASRTSSAHQCIHLAKRHTEKGDVSSKTLSRESTVVRFQECLQLGRSLVVAASAAALDSPLRRHTQRSVVVGRLRSS